MIGTATVLFTDMVGSTDQRSCLGDEAADAIRHAHDEIVAAAVTGCQGRVVKGLGDGTLATFDATSDAVAAAVRIQQAVHSHGRADPDVRFALRLGLSVGDVSHEDGDLFGTAVIEASRLCAAAQGGEILVAEAVRLLSKGRAGFTFEPMGEIELKGIPDPVAACRVMWEPEEESTAELGRVPFPGHLRPTAGLSYVGRSDLLDRLRDLWTEAADGASRAVFLAGEPGIGKTRTAAEIAKQAHAGGALVLYGRCDADLAVPFQPFVEALDWYVSSTGDPALGRLPGELARLVPELSTRVGVPKPVASDANTEQYRLFEAVASWLLDCSAGDGLVLVLDDLHWATQPTLGMLLHVLRAAATTETPPHVLIVGTYRDTDVDRGHPLSSVLADLWRVGSVERISVARLSRDEVEAFITVIAGHELDETARHLARNLYADTEGNPFFVTEVLRHLVETGVIRRDGDRWAIPDPDNLSVPEGVRDVIGRRLSQLSPEANSLLSLAAVVGRTFDLDLLTAVSDLSEDDVLDVLDEVVRARLVLELSASEFRFTHALVQTTLFEELSATRRLRLHRRVVAALEKLRPDDVVALAHHTVLAGPEGGDMSRAIAYTVAAGEQALGLRAFAEAEEHFRHALELVEEFGDTDTSVELAALCGLGEAQRDQGEPTYRETLLTAAHRAMAAGDNDALVRAALANTQGLVSLLGDVDTDAVAVLEKALDAIGTSPSADAIRLEAQLASELVWVPGSNRLRLADKAWELAQEHGDAALMREVLVRTWFPSQTSHRWRETAERVRELRRLVEASADPAWRVNALLAASPSLFAAGDIAGSREATEVANSIAATEGTPGLRHASAHMRVLFLAGASRFDEAEALNQETLELGAEMGMPDAQMYWSASHAVIAMMRGNVAELADMFGVLADTYPTIPSWRAAHIVCLALGERKDEAHEALRVHPPEIETLMNEPFPFTAATALGCTAFLLRDAALGALIAETISPYTGCWTSWGVGTLGPVDFGLGAAVAATGDHGAALGHLRDAIRISEDCGFVALGCHIRNYLAETHFERDAPGDRAEAVRVATEARDTAAATGASGNEALSNRILARFEAAAI